MPLFYWKCNECNVQLTRIYSFKESQNGEICSKCNNKMTRSEKGVNAQVYETLDNGLMSKKIERLADAQRIFSDHSKTDPFKE